MLLRLNWPTPVVGKLLWKPVRIGCGRRFMISIAARSIRFAGIVLLGKGLRALGSGFPGFDAGSYTVIGVPVKLTLPLASGRRLAGATVAVPPAAFRCVVRSRSVKKNSLFLPLKIFGIYTGPLRV